MWENVKEKKNVAACSKPCRVGFGLSQIRAFVKGSFNFYNDRKNKEEFKRLVWIGEISVEGQESIQATLKSPPNHLTGFCMV